MLKVLAVGAVLLTACSSADFDVNTAADSASVADSSADSSADDTSPLPGVDVMPESMVIDATKPDAKPPLGNAISLDGTGGGTMSGAGLVSTEGFSWELWFRPTAVPTSDVKDRAQMLVSLADGSECQNIFLGFGSEFTAQRELTLTVDGPAGCATRNSSPVHYAPAGGFVNGRWYHVVAVRSYPTNLVELYVDGALAAMDTLVRVPLTRELKVGVGRFYDGTSSSYFFKGAIDELRFYAKPLFKKEVAEHYSGGFGYKGGPGEPSLVAGFHFDEASGEAADYSTTVPRTMTFVGGVKRVEGIIPR